MDNVSTQITLPQTCHGVTCRSTNRLWQVSQALFIYVHDFVQNNVEDEVVLGSHRDQQVIGKF